MPNDIYTNPPEWNEPGTEPTQQKKDNGWQPGERPPAAWLNWWMHRTFQSLREIAQAFIGHRDATSGVHGIPEGQSVATTQDIATAVDPLAQGLAAHENRTDNPHGVTKAQVGLSNVDNAKQATKSEFDAHVADKNNPHGVTAEQIGAAPSTAVIPIGGIIMWSGSIDSIPAGWALCDGRNGTPDLRDRFIVGAGREYSVGATGGEKEVTLTTEQMPAHSHELAVALDPPTSPPITDPVLRNITGTMNGSDRELVGGGSNLRPIFGTSQTGGSTAHENRPPYYALAYIMRV